MIYKFKEYVSIEIINDKIFIAGILGVGSYYVDYTEENIEIIRKLKHEGYSIQNTAQPSLITNLMRLNVLEELGDITKKRNELFYDYIGVNIMPVLNKPILVLGAGGAGGTITYLLAQQGFTNVINIDDDYVEISDVNKTMVYDQSQVGQYKSLALKKRIQANFGISITSVVQHINSKKDFSAIIKTYAPSMVIYAIDPDPKLKIEIVNLCMSNYIPVIHSSYSYEKIICGPCSIPSRSACWHGYNEFWKKKTSGEFDYNNIHREFRETTIHPSISFNINILSSIIVKDAIFCLAGEYDKILTKGKIYIMDLLRNAISETVLSCAFCKDCAYKCKTD